MKNSGGGGNLEIFVSAPNPYCGYKRISVVTVISLKPVMDKK